jgi:PAS domain S-box-containing protein
VNNHHFEKNIRRSDKMEKAASDGLHNEAVKQPESVIAGPAVEEYGNEQLRIKLRQMHESNERLQSMIESLDVLLYVCSSDHRIEFMNARMIKRTGYDATGELCYKALHDRDSVCPWCVNERVFKGEHVRWEVRSPKDNRWYQMINTPVYHKDGRISKQAMILDVNERRQAEEHLERLFAERTTELRKTNDLLLLETSERKRANQALKKAYRQLQDIINFLPDATFVIDKKKRVIAWNRAIEEMTGVKREDILGKGDYAYSLPFYGKKRGIIVDFVMDGKSEAVKEYDVIAENRDGIVCGEALVPNIYGGRGAYLWGIATPLFDPGGNVIGAIQSIRDITGRKEAEKALRISEERFRAIFESAQESIFLKDRTFRYTLVNPAMEELLGISGSEVVGMKDDDIFGAGMAASAREADVRVFAGEIVHDQSTIQVRGATRTFHSIKVPIRDQHGEITGLCGISRDITEVKRAEQVLKDSEEQLRFLSSRLLIVQEEERRRVARDLHDTIGQYLVAVKLKVEGILQSKPETVEDAQVESLGVLVPMIQDALEEVRRICMGLRPSILDSLGIVATIGWFCRQFKKTHAHICIIQEANVEEGEVPEPLKIVIFRIIQEALSNIAKHSNAQLVNLSLAKTDSTVELIVENDGPGFDLNGALGKNAQERGFGLTGMRERAELSGGSFLIRSSTEGGTAIKASWPLR